jgi:hypothetical protein
MAGARKITIYMLDGEATGPKTIEIGNWSGKAIYSPRASLKGLLHRTEFDSPGVYFLQSDSNSEEFDSNVYIGEAEQLRARLKQHIANRDFESVICFLSKDELLTKSHIKYIEAKLIALAKDANSSLIENSIKPKGAKISEADTSDMDYFIDQIRLILPTVGINTLVAVAPHTKTASLPIAEEKQFRIKSQSLVATMIEIAGSFVVRSGSEISPTTSKSLSPGWQKIRKKLMDAGVVKEQKGALLLIEDAKFSSPSAAASVVLGRQAPGPDSWIDECGKTYKELQQEATL